MKKFFLLTIDTEGDDLWSKPTNITTRNASYLPRFQNLCEKFKLKPTYLTNYEMCIDPEFQQLGRDAIKKGTAEIGMHLHAWNSPPLLALSNNDFHNQPYLIEYPKKSIEQKLDYITKLLEETFGTKMLSHRAGRWAMDATYAKNLVRLGYKIDCSVTPFVSWSKNKGLPEGKGGTDYSLFPQDAYWMNLEDIGSKSSQKKLLQIPVTIVAKTKAFERRAKIKRALRGTFLSDWLQKKWPPAKSGDVVWLRPQKGNLKSMLWLVEQCAKEGRNYIEFMIHSSEFMPGGSPYFKTANDIEILFAEIEELFAKGTEHFQGATLTEYYNYFNKADLR